MDDEFARFQAEMAGMGGDDDAAEQQPAPKKQKVISATIMRAPQKSVEPPPEPVVSLRESAAQAIKEAQKQPAPPDYPPYQPAPPAPPPPSSMQPTAMQPSATDTYYARPQVMMQPSNPGHPGQANPIGYQAPPPPFNPATVAHLPDEERQVITQQSVYEYVPGTKTLQLKGTVEAKEKQKTQIRAAGGKTWKDETMKDWPDDDFRLFVGDLGNEVTDELLAHAFQKFSSFQKAKVIRNKFTHKSKGFGFLSFKDPIECAKALREMNGKYCGNRPMKLTRSKWKDRNVDQVRKKSKEKKKATKRGVF